MLLLSIALLFGQFNSGWPPDQVWPNQPQPIRSQQVSNVQSDPHTRAGYVILGAALIGLGGFVWFKKRQKL